MNLYALVAWLVSYVVNLFVLALGGVMLGVTSVNTRQIIVLLVGPGILALYGPIKIRESEE